MLLFVLLACGSSDRECEVVTVPVDDASDDTLDAFGFSPDQLVDTVAETRALDASDVDGRAGPATLTVTRGEGPALFADGEWLGGGRAGGLLSHDYSLNQVCMDTLTVPIELHFTASSREIDVTAVGTASVYGADRNPTDLETVFVEADIPLDTPGLPEPPETASGARVDLLFENGQVQDLMLRWVTEGSSVTMLVFPAVNPG